MPLVKAGRIVEDRYRAHRSTMRRCRTACAVIVPAARFLADAAELVAARGADRRALAEQPADRRACAVSRPARAGRAGVPDLPATAAPTARRASCASAIGFRGELRATGQVLRDQFLFLLRAGFDSFEVTKEADAAAFADSIRRSSVFYQPTGDGRATAFRRRLGARRCSAAAISATAALTPCDTGGRTGS